MRRRNSPPSPEITVEFVVSLAIVRAMRRLLKCLLLWIWLGGTMSAFADIGEVLKVLPHYLDLKGRVALSPSLYDRDAYQAQLRKQPELRSGMRFDIHWKPAGDAGKALKLRIELRGMAKGNLPRQTVLEKEVRPSSRWSRWTTLPLTGEAYKEFGEVTAWRVRLLDGDTIVSEQHSFLW